MTKAQLTTRLRREFEDAPHAHRFRIRVTTAPTRIHVDINGIKDDTATHAVTAHLIRELARFAGLPSETPLSHSGTYASFSITKQQIDQLKSSFTEPTPENPTDE